MSRYLTALLIARDCALYLEDDPAAQRWLTARLLAWAYRT